MRSPPAESVTVVPSSKTAEQSDPQSIPAGSLVTVPPPDTSTVSVGPVGVGDAVGVGDGDGEGDEGPVGEDVGDGPSEPNTSLCASPFASAAQDLVAAADALGDVLAGQLQVVTPASTGRPIIGRRAARLIHAL